MKINAKQTNQAPSVERQVQELFTHVRRAADALQTIMLELAHTLDQEEEAPAESSTVRRKLINETEQFSYTVKDVCRIVGISRSTFYALVKQGDLKAVKAGHRTLVLRSDLEGWLANLPYR